MGWLGVGCVGVRGGRWGTEIWGKGGNEETHLNLINLRGPNLRIRLHPLNLPLPEITNPNTPHLPFLHQPLQRLPHLPHRLLPPIRTVYQEQIHIRPILLPINLLHTIQAFLVRFLGRSAGGEDFGGEEDFGARDAGLTHRGAHFGLVAVELGGVDVAVSTAEGGEAGFYADGGGGAVDAEAEAGHRVGGTRDWEGGCEGEFFGGRGGHVGRGGLGGVVVFLGGGATFVCGLVFGGEEFVVGMEVACGCQRGF